MQKHIKAISLYSGGLDSILAIAAVLSAANTKVKVIPIKLITPFFNFRTKDEEKKEVFYLKDKFNLDLRIIDITEDFLKILDNPKYGFGKNLNPCVDCKILMMRKAKEIMKETGADFIFTGEVIGQRPKSQKADKLRLIEREADLKGCLLRPLSAKLLDETYPEKNKIIDRNRLFGINGRSRNIQLELAKEYDIQYFATPSGGCLLTDIEYARKVKAVKEKFGLASHLLNFLRWGRVFLINGYLLIVGRNDFENKQIIKYASKEDLLIQPLKIPGPLCAILGGAKVLECLAASEILNIAASICAKFTIKDKKKIKIQYGFKNKYMDNIEKLLTLKLEKDIQVKPIEENELTKFQI